MPGSTQPSVPPVSSASYSPLRMSRAAVRFSVTLERRRVADRHGRYRRRHAAGIVGDVELRDGARAADAAADVAPEAVAPRAERRDDAETADDDARHSVRLHVVTI